METDINGQQHLRLFFMSIHVKSVFIEISSCRRKGELNNP